MAYDEALARRIRDRLGAEPGVVEKKMFGGLGFLSHGNMTVGVSGPDLIVRLDPAGVDAALDQPGARPFEVGGRGMRNWLLVSAAALDDDALAGWIARARTFVATLPPK